MACLKAGPGRAFGSCLRPPRVSGTPSKLISPGRGDCRPIGGVPGLVRLDETLPARVPFWARADVGPRVAVSIIGLSTKGEPPKVESTGETPLLVLKNDDADAGV